MSQALLCSHKQHGKWKMFAGNCEVDIDESWAGTKEKETWGVKVSAEDECCTESHLRINFYFLNVSHCIIYSDI